MKDRKVATRYARALLASLPDNETAEKADRFLEAIRGAIEESAEFRDMLLDPAVPRNVRTSVLRTLAEQNEMPHQVGNFLATVVEHQRASALARH